MTRRERFLTEMDAVIPWSRLLALLEPHYPSAGQGRPPDLRGTVHSLTTTHAAVADITQMPELMHGQERAWYGDRAYWSEVDRSYAQMNGIRYRIQRRSHPSRPLSEREREVNRLRSKVRARGEHPFHVVKRLWGHAKVRYRGLAKNTAQLFSLFALSNLYLLRYRLGAA